MSSPWGSETEWGGAGPSWGSDVPWGADEPPGYTRLVVPEPVSVTPLVVGLVVSVLGAVAIPIAAERHTLPLPLLGWVLCAFVSVIFIGVYQTAELRQRSLSRAYNSHPYGSVLRNAILIVGTIGIIVNSYLIAGWVATR